MRASVLVVAVLMLLAPRADRKFATSTRMASHTGCRRRSRSHRSTGDRPSSRSCGRSTHRGPYRCATGPRRHESPARPRPRGKRRHGRV